MCAVCGFESHGGTFGGKGVKANIVLYFVVVNIYKHTNIYRYKKVTEEKVFKKFSFSVFLNIGKVGFRQLNTMTYN